jgi:hypothetical protein
MNEVDNIIAEGHALTRALAVTEAGGSIEEARRACMAYLENHHVDSVEALVIDCALRRICALPLVAHTSTQLPEIASSLEGVLLHEGIIRWLDWVDSAHLDVGVNTGESRTTSVLNRMALTQWLAAVDHLSRGGHDEARRLFRRAVTLGGHYGTPSNPIIQWTYAASFFPEE